MLLLVTTKAINLDHHSFILVTIINNNGATFKPATATTSSMESSQPSPGHRPSPRSCPKYSLTSSDHLCSKRHLHRPREQSHPLLTFSFHLPNELNPTPSVLTDSFCPVFTQLRRSPLIPLSRTRQSRTSFKPIPKSSRTDCLSPSPVTP